ncbi:MAG: DUF4124 domain-containing protein [Acinetobacter sp.]|nr:MAG: DUF4124 domain-containing protein [Acinetobacter sp.]
MNNVKTKILYLPTLSLILGLSLSTLGHTQNFYKWVDANGSVHYSDTAPTSKKVKVEKVGTYNDTPSGHNAQPATAEKTAQTNNNAAPAPEATTQTKEAAPAPAISTARE